MTNQPDRPEIRKVNIDVWDDADGYLIHCPYCDLEFNHTGTFRKELGKDDYQASWWGRGDLIVIPMQCENGHMWELCVGFHKGQLYMFGREGTETIIEFADDE